MSLEVTVKSAANLPNVERFGKSDPFAVLVYQGEAAGPALVVTQLFLIFFHNSLVFRSEEQNCSY